MYVHCTLYSTGLYTVHSTVYSSQLTYVLLHGYFICLMYRIPGPEESCRGHLCQNEGTCVPGAASSSSNYTCSCLHPYGGRFCEEGPAIAMMYQSISPCSHHDCQHGHCQVYSGKVLQCVLVPGRQYNNLRISCKNEQKFSV